MTRLIWDETGNKFYETGTSHGVLYTMGDAGAYNTGVAWNGLISVKQSPDGAEASDTYANNHKYVSMVSAENFKGSISAYTYPDDFMECDGSKEVSTGVYAGQQRRKMFGLSYSTIIGNDTEGIDYGEKIHVIYNAKVSPASREYSTINDNPEAIEFSWDFSTTPSDFGAELEELGFKPTAYIAIDCSKLQPEAVKRIKDTLWGGAEGKEPTLPTIKELVELAKGVNDPAHPQG